MSEPVNPYLAPRNDELRDTPRGPDGDLDRAVAGQYDFTIGEVMSEAWQLTRGFKATFWGAAIIIYLLVGGLMGVTLAVAGVGGRESGAGLVAQIVINVVMGVLGYPLGMGIFLLAIRRAGGLPVSFGVAFQTFGMLVPLVITGFLVTLLTYLGFLLIIPGIYLSVAYILAGSLVVDRQLAPWRAMETSRKALTKRWWKVFGLMIVVTLLLGLSALPLGIGLIWTAPWAALTFGVLYRRIFGVATRA